MVRRNDRVDGSGKAKVNIGGGLRGELGGKGQGREDEGTRQGEIYCR